MFECVFVYVVCPRVSESLLDSIQSALDYSFEKLIMGLFEAFNRSYGGACGFASFTGL